MSFHLTANFSPTGDQPQAIEKLTHWLRNGVPRSTLLGITGSGKTYTMSAVIEKLQRPALVISHNKTLASQLYQELKDFFPNNAVHYFVSYYDYYQPEAYIPQTDTYIEKDAAINEEIDRLRHAATQAILTRRDSIIVASVSCIYNIGSPEEYEKAALTLKPNQPLKRLALLRTLGALQYDRNDAVLLPGSFRVRGDTIDIFLPTGSEVMRLELFGDTLEHVRLAQIGRAFQIIALDNQHFAEVKEAKLFPAKHFVTPQEQLNLALKNIEQELRERLNFLRREGKLVEAQRLEERTTYDLEMIRTTGFCSGIENYSRQLEFRKPNAPPHPLLDYFPASPAGGPKDFLTFIDESHMSLPQIRGMYAGDRSRKETLVRYGFRLPSSLDNRPLRFCEFEKRVGQVVFLSATPGPYERAASADAAGHQFVAEQLIRPTGLLDPTLEVVPTNGQLEHLMAAIKARTDKKERTLITTLTKRSAEHLAEYLTEKGIKAVYLHGDIHTLERPEVLYDFRKGKFDVLIGINLLREGLDLPEVALVAILDADKAGFLRTPTTLIQTMGRAARHINGHVILYADTISPAMAQAMSETERRRAVQTAYNQQHGITPQSIQKAVKRMSLIGKKPKPEAALKLSIKQRLAAATAAERDAIIADIEQQMLDAAEALEFEKAAVLRDELKKLTS